ncbi:hypothetical protein HWV23_02695 [Natronomonas halophila]|uniref:hypothetical protein n=1 Tax=Natronomonas halophila TaxID=2747817 RepID=UPI0015B4E105|nr:hypothetical protein [Natronomonas halophila]QLD84608.1 hypothetical protein HWV23_02410 [Natronomonas halophila]QLD84664.1 hypothetical protein HWV23_02695 [Natronomonas halophila]
MDVTTRLSQVQLALLVAVLVVVGTAGAATLLTAGTGVMFDHPDGISVTLDEDTGIAGDNPFGTDGSVTIQNTTVDGPAGSSTRLAGPSSDAPTLSAIDSNGGTMEANTTGIQTVGVSGVSSITYRDVDLQDTTTTEFDVGGTGTLYVHGFSAGQWIRVNRANGDDELVQAGGSGVATISISSGAQLTLVEPKGGPTLSDPSPTNGEEFSDVEVNLSVNVTDPDFDTTNEEVTLEWYVDGELNGTTTVTSNGTATYTATVSEGGEHEWYVVATDSTGDTAQSGSDSNPHTFATPGTLYIREESDPTTLIDGIDVELRFYFSDGESLIVSRTATDGTVNMTGLPADRPFVVVAEADGYYPRRIYKQSLVESDIVYLLNDTEQAVSPTFELIDYSGRFADEDTVMLIQRGLANESGDIDWRTVQGDYFGANGEFPAQLRYNVRHRLVLINTETGARTVKGQYTPTDDSAQEVTVRPDGTITLDEQAALITVAPSTRTLLESDTAGVTVDFDSETVEIESWDLTIRAQNETNSSTLYQTSGTGSATVQPELNLTGWGGGNVTVEATASLSNGETIEESITFAVRTTYDNEYALLPVLADVPAHLPSGGGGALTFLAMLVTVFGSAAVASTTASTEVVGLTAVGFIGGFYVIGWVSESLMFITVIAFVAIAATRRGL